MILNHEKVAERYRVNSIHLAKEVSDRIVADEFNWNDDFKDLHPSEFGHEIYARSITTFLDDAVEKASKEGLNPLIWDNNVELMIYKLADPKIYRSSDIRCGAYRGGAVDYVRIIYSKYQSWR